MDILEQIVTMYEDEYLTFGEIGRALGISEEYTAYLYFRAKKTRPIAEPDN